MIGEQEAKVLAGVTRLARIMNSEARPERMHEAILEEAERVASCEEVKLYLYRAGDEYPSRLARRDQALIRWEDLTREQVCALLVEGALLAEATRQRVTVLYAPRDGALAGCAVPLVAREGLQGVLTFQQREPFTEEDRERLSQLGEVAAAAMTLATLSTQEQERQVRFLSKLSHELRSPLNAINGYLDLALSGMGGELNAQQREFMQRARAGSEYLYSLMEDLLLLGRANIGQLYLRRQIAQLSEIIENAVEDLELILQDTQVSIETRIPVHLPPIYVDPIRIQQVLRNLLTYALGFAEAGAIIVISAIAEVTDREANSEEQERGGMLSIEIETAMNKSIEERQEFVRALSIARLIVELHGGTLQQKSREDGQYVVRGRLPVLLT